MSQPAPVAPDYAASARAGAESNAELLPMQIGVDRAARMGNVYTDPLTGRSYDFTGMGDAQLNDLDAASSERLMTSGANIQRQLTKDQYSDLMDMLPKYNQLNLDMQKQAQQDSIDASGQLTKNQYDQNLQYMPLFGDLQRSEDAKTFESNLDLGDEGAQRSLASQLEAARAGKAAENELNPERAALRKQLGQSLLDSVNGPGLTAGEQEDMEQSIRGAQAARGNILGAGAGYDESKTIQRAGEDAQQSRRQQALAYLSAPDTSTQFSTPMAPNYATTGQINPTVPNFGATTAAGPNLNPVGINSTKGMSYLSTDTSGATKMASDNYSQQMQAKSQGGNPWMQGLGIAASAASMMMM